VYATLVGSKHLFQNLVANIVEVQTLGGIVPLGGDFNARNVVLLDTIDTNDLYELLHVPELAETKQLSAMAQR
jgi:hypothetical protein